MTTTCFSRPAFKSRVVPVIVLKDAAQAVPLAHALLEGGIDVMEITLRSGVGAARRQGELRARAHHLGHLGRARDGAGTLVHLGHGARPR